MASPKRRHDLHNDDFALTVEEPRPLIVPGLYEAVSTSVRRRRYRDRPFLEVLFDIFEGSIPDGLAIARSVPGFFNLPAVGCPLGKSSRLARLIQLIDPAIRRDRVPVQMIRGKYLRVRVVTVSSDGQQNDLPAANRYSKVAAVLERLA